MPYKCPIIEKTNNFDQVAIPKKSINRLILQDKFKLNKSSLFVGKVTFILTKISKSTALLFFNWTIQREIQCLRESKISCHRLEMVCKLLSKPPVLPFVWNTKETGLQKNVLNMLCLFFWLNDFRINNYLPRRGTSFLSTHIFREDAILPAFNHGGPK